MYDELIAELRRYNNDGTEELRRQAADALEELQSKNSELLNDFENYSEYCKAKIEELSEQLEAETEYATALNSYVPQWIPVTERLPECDLGAEVGNIEWISNGMVHAGCFGRGGKYRDAYFRTWTDAGEGMDAKDADYWRAITLPKPPKEE